MGSEFVRGSLDPTNADEPQGLIKPGSRKNIDLMFREQLWDLVFLTLVVTHHQ